MEETLARSIMYFSSVFGLVPAILTLWRWRRSDREQRLLGILVGIAVVIELLAMFIGAGLHLNNLFLLHIFTVIELGLLALMFGPSIVSLLPSSGLRLLLVAFSIFAIFNSIYIDGITRFNAFAKAIEALFVISFVLMYFYHILRTLEIKHLDQAPLFWISAGSLIYFSGSLFVFIYSNKIVSSLSSSFTIWGIHAFLTILKNTFYTIALWIRSNKLDYPYSSSRDW